MSSAGFSSVPQPSGGNNSRSLKDFDDFASDPLPAASYVEYRTYMRRSMQFIRSRNMRIAEYSATTLQDQT